MLEYINIGVKRSCVFLIFIDCRKRQNSPSSSKGKNAPKSPVSLFPVTLSPVYILEPEFMRFCETIVLVDNISGGGSHN